MGYKKCSVKSKIMTDLVTKPLSFFSLSLSIPSLLLFFCPFSFLLSSFFSSFLSL